MRDAILCELQEVTRCHPANAQRNFMSKESVIAMLGSVTASKAIHNCAVWLNLNSMNVALTVFVEPYMCRVESKQSSVSVDEIHMHGSKRLRSLEVFPWRACHQRDFDMVGYWRRCDSCL